MAAPIGTCRLCLANTVSLRDSHIVPAWAYKRIRGDQGGNPNPIYVSDGKAVPTSKQFSEHLLCADCEQKLGVTDNYLAKLAYTDGQPVPGFADVGRVVGRHGVYQMAEPGKLDAGKLAYFAASIAWRGHIASTLPDSTLGPHAEPFRQYLLGQRAFPSKCGVAVCVLRDDEPDWERIARTITMPKTQRKAQHFTVEFMLCGFYFTLHTGLASPLPGGLSDAQPLIGLAPKTEFVRWIAEPIANARLVGGR